MSDSATVGELLIKLRADGSGLSTSIKGEVTKAEGALKELEKAGEKAGKNLGEGLDKGLKSGGGATAGVDRLRQAFGNLTKDVAPASQNVEKFGTTALGASTGMTALGIGAGVVATAVGKSIQAFSAQAAEIDKFKSATGASTQAANDVINAFDDVGVSGEVASAAFVKMSRAVPTGALEKLGIETAKTKSGQTDLVGTFDNVLKKLDGTQDAAEKNRIAFAAFGRSFLELAPILRQGSEGFQKLVGANIDLRLSDSDLAQAREFKMTMNALGDSVKNLEFTVARVSLPFLTTAADDAKVLLEGLHKIGDYIPKIPGVNLAESALSALGPLGQVAVALHGVAEATKDNDKAVNKWAGQFDDLVRGKISAVTDQINSLGGAAGLTAKEMEDLANAEKAAFDKQFVGIDSALGLASAQQAVVKAQEALNADLGIGSSAQVTNAEKTLKAAQASHDAAQAAKALADAKAGEASAAKQAADGVAAAEQKLNDTRARSADLERAISSARRDAQRANDALYRSQVDLAKAQEDYDRTIGKLPPKIDDVTKALYAQFDAQDKVASLTDDLQATQDRIAQAQEKLANFDQNGQNKALEDFARLQLAAQQATTRRQEAEAEAAKLSKTQTEADAKAQALKAAQLDEIAANRAVQEQGPEILNTAAKRRELQRDLNALIERQRKLQLEELPQAQKDQADTTQKANGTLGGFAVGSDEEIAARKNLADAQSTNNDLTDAAIEKGQKLVDSQLALSQNARDAIKDQEAVSQAVVDGQKIRKTAHDAVIQALADEHLRQLAIRVEVAKTSDELSKLPGKVAADTLAVQQADTALVRAGGNGEKAVENLKAVVKSLPKDLQKSVQDTIALLGTIKSQVDISVAGAKQAAADYGKSLAGITGAAPLAFPATPIPAAGKGAAVGGATAGTATGTFVQRPAGMSDAGVAWINRHPELLPAGVAGYRRAGGPVDAGKPYIVGEERPEVFVPNQSGNILPSVPGGGNINAQFLISGGLAGQVQSTVFDALQGLARRNGATLTVGAGR